MNWTLEVVVVPVSDLDRAKAFYAEQVGFAVDHDTAIRAGMRVIQLTPPGSGCSIVIGTGIAKMAPGSLQGLQLVVSDIQAARKMLVERGVAVSPVRHYEGARPGRRSGRSLELVHLLPGPGRQQLDGPGAAGR